MPTNQSANDDESIQLPDCHSSIIHQYDVNALTSCLFDQLTVSRANTHSSHSTVSCTRAHIHHTQAVYSHISLIIMTLILSLLAHHQSINYDPITPNNPARYPVSFSSEPDRQNSHLCLPMKNNRKVETKYQEHISLFAHQHPLLRIYPFMHQREPISGLKKKGEKSRSSTQGEKREQNGWFRGIIS